jgi:Beta-1,3-glucanase
VGKLGRYWLVFGLLAVAVSACTSHGSSPLPFAPNAMFAPASNGDDEAEQGLDPGARACYTEKAQPEWIFRGACRQHPFKKRGSGFFLPAFDGYKVAIKFPRNDARPGARVLVVNATGAASIRRWRGKAFPLDAKAFLYLKIVNAGKPIKLLAGNKTSIDIVTANGGLGAPCSVDVLDGASRWKALDVTGSLSKASLSYLIPPKKFKRLKRGASYLAFACAEEPTPTPSSSPTTSPTTSPTASPQCATGYTGTNGVPVSVVNSSGLNVPVYLYALTNGDTAYLGSDGKVHNFAKGGGDVPGFPVCPGKAFIFPANLSTTVNANQGGGRLYVAFGKMTIKNSDRTPAVNDPNNHQLLWDFIEINPVVKNAASSSSAISYVNIDTTQVDAFALPFSAKVTDAGGNTYKFGFKNYANIYNAVNANPAFAKLIVKGTVGATSVPLRIVSPEDAILYGIGSFPSNYFTSSGYYAGSGSGYLGALETYYANANVSSSPTYHKILYVPYQTQYGTPPPGNSPAPACNATPSPSSSEAASGTLCPTYYAYYDSNGFEFSVASTPSPFPGQTPYPFPSTFTIPTSDLSALDIFENYQPIALVTPFWQNLTQQVDYYLMKALTTDLNRGVAMQTGYHAVAPNGLGYGVSNIGTNYYPSGNLFNAYSQILHNNAENVASPGSEPGNAYGFPYDDLFKQSTDISTSGSVKTFTLTIQPMIPY